jgi:hypothetical protein
VPPVSWSVYLELPVDAAAIASSGRLIVWARPSSVSGIGVAWLPTTTPRASSTSWANTWVAVPVPE